MASPNLMVIDAARFERMAAGERSALLDRVAKGMPLLVLGGNANDPASGHARCNCRYARSRWAPRSTRC